MSERACRRPTRLLSSAASSARDSGKRVGISSSARGNRSKHHGRSRDHRRRAALTRDRRPPLGGLGVVRRRRTVPGDVRARPRARGRRLAGAELAPGRAWRRARDLRSGRRLSRSDGAPNDHPNRGGNLHDRGRATTRRHSQPFPSAWPALPSCVSSAQSAVPMRTRRGRSECRRRAESKLVCERDRLPELGVVSLSAYAPFLSLHEPEAARWAASRR